MATVSLSATLVNSGSSSGCGCAGGTEFPLAFYQGANTYATVLQSNAAVSFSSVTWRRLPLACDLSTVSLLAIAAATGSTLKLLIGTPPTWSGVSGTFPTGFSGGETFTFLMQTYNSTTGAYVTTATIPVVFTSAAQTAAQVANEVNAKLASLGFGNLVSVVGGQLVIAGATPGQSYRLTNSVANTTIGFASSNTGAVGVGNEVSVPGVFLAELSAVPSSSIWAMGTATMNILLGGA